MTALEILAPFVGATALEVVHWYQLREKLHLLKYRKLLRSPYYWVFTIAMIVVGSFATLIVFGNDNSAGKLLILGAAFPTLFKKLIDATAKDITTLGGGEGEESKISWRDYFRVNN